MIKYLPLILLLTGCYTERKAKNQFAKAAVAYPKISAEHCANEFPVKDSTIRDTLITSDTVFIQGGITEDTIIMRVNDTVRITIIRELPGKVITNTIHVTDTIFQTNTAAIAACNIDKSSLTDLLVNKTAEADKYKGQAKKRGWFLWGLIALLVLYTGLRIYLKLKPTINAN